MGYVVNEAAAFCAGGGALESAHHVHRGRSPARGAPGNRVAFAVAASMVLRKIEEGLDKEEPSLSVTTAPLIRPNFETLSHIAHLRAAQKRNSRCIFQVKTHFTILRTTVLATQRSR